jgi:hypothetical protein
MNKITKILLVIGVCFGIALSSLADGGIGRKKNRATVNIAAPSTLRAAISLNLKAGLKYTGSLLTKQQASSNSIFTSSLVTYQKGNTVYIIPYKHVITMPEIKPGYTGMKVIIRPH